MTRFFIKEMWCAATSRLYSINEPPMKTNTTVKASRRRLVLRPTYNSFNTQDQCWSFKFSIKGKLQNQHLRALSELRGRKC